MLGLFFLVLTFIDNKPPQEIKLEPIGRLNHEAIREASGIVKSRKHPGIYWVLNDSGNPNTIFAVKADGSLVREFLLSVLNIDWEDIATDDDGHLYIGDIGNNKNLLGRRVVHQIDEPDPSGEPASREPLKIRKSWFYQFPKEGRFDSEGLFIQGDSIRLIGKSKDGLDAVVYSLPIAAESSRLQPLTIERMASLVGFVEPVTGACISIDGKWLAVCSLGRLAVFKLADGGNWKLFATRRFHVDDQIEAICWDGADLVLAGEKRGVYRVSEKDWRGHGN